MLIVVGPAAALLHERPGHPERPARVDAVMNGIADLHLDSDLLIVPACPADRGQLDRSHAPGYLDQLRQFCATGGGSLDADTFATPDSWEAACLAAGAGLVAVEALRRNGGTAFVAARPPGHHALGDRSMGFCLINNVAVTAASLVDAGERVLIVDWDVHHGNGTQAMFWDNPDVLYVSAHQWPCYPGTGRADEVGGPQARGTTVNVPLPPGTTGDMLLQAFDQVVAPVVDRFAPTWVLVSAGFDAHRADPLAEWSLTAGDFADLALAVSDYAPRSGRLVLFLEGGYDLGALRSSVTACLGTLVGALVAAEPRSSGGASVDHVRLVAERRRAELERAI
jgi:acetoin utilization deacetylase AcuC-like enzyme